MSSRPAAPKGAGTAARSARLDRRSSRQMFGWVALASVAALGAALVSQHAFDMQPCPWCVLQRALFVLLALAGVLGWAWRSATGGRVAAVAGVVVALLGAAAAVWQHVVAAQSASCNRTLADRIISGLGLDSWVPSVFAATASCADAKVELFGMPYEYWSLALFSLLGLGLIAWLVRAR